MRTLALSSHIVLASPMHSFRSFTSSLYKKGFLNGEARLFRLLPNCHEFFETEPNRSPLFIPFLPPPPSSHRNFMRSPQFSLPTREKEEEEKRSPKFFPPFPPSSSSFPF